MPSQGTKAATGLTQAVSSAASTGEGDGGAGFLGFVEPAAGALLGGNDADLSGDAIEGESATLSDAQPFDYQPLELSADVAQLAKSTNNPDYAAKMLGYDRDTFGDMVHVMKDDLDLRGDDNVIWHDNGNIEFRKNIIGNMHDYAF
ncbi:hypothetical protein [Paraburkholderia sp. J11-2]|uniref:hypothetical protein n=2 Tax=unclassified Paraburkholderia TaxID=2615204 RepID=UPI002AB5E758|nr:hypothetical protein [Paraburkholderia sp. J11-2]